MDATKRKRGSVDEREKERVNGKSAKEFSLSLSLCSKSFLYLSPKKKK
jgi:hypothetical protein